MAGRGEAAGGRGAAGGPGLAGAEVQPRRLAAEPAGAAAMASIVSYESLVHAVSGAVVSERVWGLGEGASRRRRRPAAGPGSGAPGWRVGRKGGRGGLVGSTGEVTGTLRSLGVRA